MKNKKIGYHMVTSVKYTVPETSLNGALEEMTRFNIRHLPVLQEGKLMGLVSERDIKAAINISEVSGLTVGDVMARDVYVVDSMTPLSEVAGTMAAEKFGSAVIVNSKNQVKGIFTTTDALRILADMGEGGAVEAFLDCYDDYISMGQRLTASNAY